MPRKVLPIGPCTLAVIEDARVDLARAVLGVREGENEPTFNLPEDVADQTDDEAVDVFRKDLIETLSQFAPDELRPAEQRCRRIRAFAEGKGVTSLTTIVEQQLNDEQSREFENQPDQLCKSVNFHAKVSRLFHREVSHL